MSPEQCIYIRAEDACVCWRLCGVRPNCPHYDAGDCRCGGYVGRQGVLGDQRPQFVMEESAPTLLRYRV